MERSKLLIALLACLLMCTTAQSQVYYKCVVNGALVRTGPGTNYRVLKYYSQGGNSPKDARLSKGWILASDGRQRNGFIHVEDLTSHGNFGDGWVSAKSLVKMTRKCPSCRGRGFFNKPCDNCGGSDFGCLVCDYSGHLRCERCRGLGVL